MRGALVAVVAVGYAACADPGDFHPTLASVLEPSAGQTQVSSGSYSMRFARTGVMLPESLLIGDTDEVLAAGACPYESLAGIALYPATRAAAGVVDDVSTGTLVTSSLAVTEQGPGVVMVEVTFDVVYRCADNDHLTGTSTYTFFPSGRIARHDVVSSGTINKSDSRFCGCNQNIDANWFFTSYWMLNTPHLVGPEGSMLTPNAEVPRSCAAIGNNLVGIAWGPGDTRYANGGGHPASVFDFQEGVDTLIAEQRAATSELQIGYGLVEADCASVLGELDAPSLTIDSAPIAMNEHGLYVDSRVHNDTFVLRADAGRIPPFGVILDLGSAKHVRVSREPSSYTVQPARGGGTLFYFSDELATGQSIEITPY